MKIIKTFIALLIVFAFTLMLASCTGKADKPTPAPAPAATEAPAAAPAPASPITDTASEAPAAPAVPTAPLIGWMAEGRFYYEFTMTSVGPDGETRISGSVASDGGNTSMRTVASAEGITLSQRVLVKDGAAYMINDENKSYASLPDTDEPEMIVTDFSNITPVGSGTGEIDGKTLPYEEYATSEQGETVRYYIDNGEVYGIVSEDGEYKNVMIIKNQSRNAPAGEFELPAGYTETDLFGAVGFDMSDLMPEEFELPDGFEWPEGFELPAGFELP